MALILNFNWEEVPGIGGSLARGFHTYFDRHVTFLDQCRPLPVTVRGAVQYIKIMLHRLDDVDSPEEVSRFLVLSASNSFSPMLRDVHHFRGVLFFELHGFKVIRRIGS